MNIVVVESPSKAKTINKYLGPDYEVFASFGHIRDLPPKDGSVDPDNKFAMLWEIDAKSQQRVNDIARALKGADKLILATDPDREGEAISWHILEALRQKDALKDHKIERVVFNAITKQSVSEAMKNPRQIDGALVDAYLARRALDYLVGFTLSPVLWRKLPGARSAGRVQSVALRLVCDRELEIEKFVAKEYWSILARLATPRNDVFEARLVGADGQKIQRLDINSGAEAEAFTRDLENANFTVTSVEAKPTRRNPPPPFTTSTMQQEASRKLGYAPAVAMRHGLDPACRAGAGQFAPQDRGEGEAHVVIEGAVGEIRVDQGLVDLARLAQRGLDRVLGDGVEGHALDRQVLQHALFTQGFQNVPGDRLALAVRVGGEDELLGPLDRLGNVGNPLRAPVLERPDHAEIGIRVDRAVLGGQVADMPEGGQDLVILAEIFVDRLGLRRRLDDEDFHERLPKSGNRRTPCCQGESDGRPGPPQGGNKWLMIGDKSNRTCPKVPYMATKARSSKGFTASARSLAPIIRDGAARRVRA